MIMFDYIKHNFQKNPEIELKFLEEWTAIVALTITDSLDSEIWYIASSSL